MKNRKSPTESEVSEWLRDGQLRLPPLRFQLTKARQKYSDNRQWDFEIKAVWDDNTASFAVEYKSHFNPKAFDEALRRCRAGILPDGLSPLILMPYLRPPQLEELESNGIS